MLDHVSLGITDMKRSQGFYDAVLKPLGISRFYDYDGGSGYGRRGAVGDDSRDAAAKGLRPENRGE